MKKKLLNFKSINIKSLLFILGSLFVLASCTKDDVDTPKASGPPTIERIRLTDTTTRDSSLTKTTLGSTIAIMGTNLATARQVIFNGYALNVNPVYATDNVLIITVHDSVPTVATNPNVPDELKVVTAGGEVTYKFKILPPRPEIVSISNEFAKPGETVTLYGKYFYFVDTVSFGAVKVTSGIVTTGKTLTVTVPAGVNLANSDITVRSQSGISVVGRTSKFYNPARTSMLMDWDAKNSWGGTLNFGWGLDADKKVGDNLGFAPISGRYAVIDQSMPAGWGWNNDKVINLNNWDGSVNGGTIWPSNPNNFTASTPLSSVDLKFEVSSLFPVGDIMATVWQSDFAANVNLKDFVKSADGKWYTVTINLGNMAKDNSKLATYGDISGQNEIRLLFQNPTSADIVSKFAVDNIRIVNNVR